MLTNHQCPLPATPGAWDVWYLEAETEKSLGLPVARRRATWAQRLRYLRVLLGVEDGSFATGTPAMAHAKVGAWQRLRGA